MTPTNTILLSKHKNLISVFFQANNLGTISITEYEDIENYGHQQLIRLWCTDEEENALTYMGFKHSGVQNMLEHYLMKCGVHIDHLHPYKPLSMKDALQDVLKNK